MSRTYGDRGDKDNKIRLLKRQLESLKRENARLQRELQKAQSMIDELLSESVQEDTDVRKPARKRGDGLVCSDCGKGTLVPMTVKFRDGVEKTYLNCNLCKASKTQR